MCNIQRQYHRFNLETILVECLHEKKWLCWRCESGSYIYISTHISKVFKVSGRYIHSYRCINQLLANGTMIGSRKGKNSIPCHAIPHWRDHGSRGEVIVFGGAVGVLFMGRTIGFNLFASIS